MAKKICSFIDITTKSFPAPVYQDPENPTGWNFLGLVEGVTYFSFDDEKVTVGTDDADFQFKIYDFSNEDDTAAIKLVINSFGDVKQTLENLEIKFMNSRNVFTAMKKIQEDGGDFSTVLAELETAKNEYLQGLGFPGTEILN